MRLRVTILMAFCLVFIQVQGSPALKKIMNWFESGKLDKAIPALQLSLKESPGHPGYLWLMARLTSTDTLEYYDIDSAYSLIKKSIAGYDSLTEEVIKSLEKAEVIKQQIIDTDLDIRELHWKRTQDLLTLDAIGDFRARYPEAPQNNEAIYLRDSLAYFKATTVDTWEAYQSYMRDFPESIFLKKAKRKYDDLLYIDKTSAGTRESYASFVSSYPSSPHREEAIGHIWQFDLFWNDAGKIKEFVREYAGSIHIRNALIYLYHLDPSLIDSEELYGSFSARDSLLRIEASNGHEVYLYPSNQGMILYQLGLDARKVFDFSRIINKEAHCKVFQDKLIAGYNKSEQISYVRNRLGSELYSGSFSEFREVGLGTFWVGDQANGKLVHHTGRLIADEVSSADLYVDNLIMVERDDQFGFVSLNGKMMVPFQFDKVFTEGSFCLFAKDGKYAITNSTQIRGKILKEAIDLEFLYDDYELINDSMLIVAEGDREGLLNARLEPVIPLKSHSIYPNGLFPYAKEDSVFRIYAYHFSFEGEEVFESISQNDRWMILKNEGWSALGKWDINGTIYSYDSVKAIGATQLYVSIGDSSWIWTDADHKISISPVVEQVSALSALPHRNEHYLVIESNGKKAVLDVNGKSLFEDKFESITAMGDSMFVMKKRGKFGLYDMRGQVVLDNEYDFVAREKDLLTLLQKGQIGAYFMKDSTLIQPSYGSNLEEFGSYLRTTRDGLFGLLSKEGEEIMPFSNIQLSYLNDSLVWVKTDSAWQIQKINDGSIYQFGVRSFVPIGSEDRRFFLTLKENGYGLLDDSAMFIIPPVYSDIRIIEGNTGPLFIGEKSFPEAGFYLWVGYDVSGRKIFSEAYREEDYDYYVCE